MVQSVPQYAGSRSLGRRVAVVAAAVVLGYVLLILVFPRVVDGYQYHALNDRLGSIERSFAVLLDRTGARSGALVTAGPIEASLASMSVPSDESVLTDRLDRMTQALERLEAAVEAQTRALEALAPTFDSRVDGLEARDSK